MHLFYTFSTTCLHLIALQRATSNMKLKTEHSLHTFSVGWNSSHWTTLQRSRFLFANLTLLTQLKVSEKNEQKKVMSSKTMSSNHLNFIMCLLQHPDHWISNLLLKISINCTVTIDIFILHFCTFLLTEKSI